MKFSNDEEFEDEANFEEEGQQADDEEVLAKRRKIEQAVQSNGWNYFSRGVCQQIDRSQEFRFMNLEADHTGGQANQGSNIRLYGVTEHGNSVMVTVTEFVSYFYVQKPVNIVLDTTQQINDFINLMNHTLEQQKEKPQIQGIEVCRRESVRYYKGKDSQVDFIKMICNQPKNVRKIREWIEKDGRLLESIQFDGQTYESNMPFALRMMIDKDIVGMGWVGLEGGKYKVLEQSQKKSSCQIEIIVEHSSIRAIPTTEMPAIAPLRILSFDIECAAEKGFPDPNRDPIIQIACIVKEHNEKDDKIRVVFTLGSCESIPGSHVKSFDQESEMLEQFENFVQALDPDIITGYNIQGFDLPYILDRAKALKMTNYGYFPRIIKIKSSVSNGKFLSKAMGMRDTKQVNIQGRVQLDMMMHIMRDHKLSSYSLNNVSYHFLKEQKEDVHHSIIKKLQREGPESRKRIAVYCLKDAYLPIKLIEKLMCVYNYSEMARVTGVPINYLFMRGQQIKVASMLYRKAKVCGFIIPTEKFVKGNDGVQFQGAYVLDPITKYYQNPIATLDFASLYPSIMMAHNLCYTTLLPNNNIKGIREEDYTVAPSTYAKFVKPSVRKGLLPLILEELISARKQARAELAKTTDPMLKAVLDGRQLALKISANSVYGFTGAVVGQLPCLAISASVTGFGREMIEKTKKLVEENYPGSTVIYGDTDSVMVDFNVSDLKVAMELGRSAAEKISQEFLKPIKLEFEKVYWPYLLMNRKRYAGLYWTKTDKWDKIDTKGIESVRRDNCALIRKMISKVLELILIEKDIQGAFEYTRQTISQLLQNQIDISDLVITKSLNDKQKDKPKDKGMPNQEHTKAPANNTSKTNKDKENDKDKDNKLANTYKAKQAHVILAQKMQKRDEATAPAAGDRIPYVMIDGGRGTKNYENAEDPIYVMEKNLPIDFDYYIEKQLKKPLDRIFSLMTKNTDVIFKGNHNLTRYIPKLGADSAMSKFIVKKNFCLSCKSKQVDGKNPICQPCMPKTLKSIIQKQEELQEIETLRHSLQIQCQRCQGSLHQEVICQNRDCEIFYRRIKTQKDLESKQQELERFESW